MTADAATGALVPEPSLRAWIGDRLPGDGPFELQRVTAGRSNELFLLERGGHRWMLRRPPRVANAPTAHSMAREFQVLAALDGSDVPHPRGLLLCEDPDVLGAPFYVMDVVDGRSLYAELPPALDTATHRRAIGHAVVDALAALHRVDWEERGLAGFGKPAGFTARQVDRWMAQLDSYRTRPLPDLDGAAAWLRANTPDMQRPALIHGDYGLHNVLFAAEPPVQLRAVVDFETATIGDPLLDLGYLLTLWLEGDEPDRWTAAALPYPIAGYPPRAELAARYAEATGLDLAPLDWYRAVSQLKVACILEGGFTRFQRGQTDDPAMADLGDRVVNHAAYALAITRGEA